VPAVAASGEMPVFILLCDLCVFAPFALKMFSKKPGHAPVFQLNSETI
jgi:hypothetical protein